MTGKATVKTKYRRLCMSRESSALVRASVPAMSVLLPCDKSVGRIVFRGDGEEGLFKAEAGDLDLARPVARVEDGVKRGVRVARLDLHHVVPDLEVHQPGQAEQEGLVHLVQAEGEPPGPGPRLDLGGRAVGEQTAPVDDQDPVRRLVGLLQVVRANRSVRPAATSSFMLFQNSRRVSTSMAAVGSSST